MPKTANFRKNAIVQSVNKFFMLTGDDTKLSCSEIFAKIRIDLAGQKIDVTEKAIALIITGHFLLKKGRLNNAAGNRCYIGIKFKTDSPAHDQSSPDTAALLDQLMGVAPKNNSSNNKGLDELPVEVIEKVAELAVSTANYDLPPVDAFSPLLPLVEMLQKATIDQQKSTNVATQTMQPGLNLQVVKQESMCYIPCNETDHFCEITEDEFSISKDQLGKGIAGSVYEGVLNGSPCAIKKFRTHHAFLAEQFVHSCLLKSEPAICRAIGYNVEQKLLFLPLLSTADGWNRADRVSDPTDFKAMVTSMAVCLQGLHAMKVLHNDLKSDNFLINVKLRKVQLIDFGNSTSFFNDDPLTLNFTHSSHIHPLVRNRKMGYCIASDIYSFGDLVTFMGKTYDNPKLVSFGKSITSESVRNVKKVNCQNLLKKIDKYL